MRVLSIALCYLRWFQLNNGLSLRRILGYNNYRKNSNNLILGEPDDATRTHARTVQNTHNKNAKNTVEVEGILYSVG